MADDHHTLTAYAERLLRLGAGTLIGAENSPYFLPLDEARIAAAEAGKRFVSFANYDYLGLSHHPDITRAVEDALHRFGTGALASRIVGGERSIHRALERELANFCGTEDTLAMVSGYLANASLLTHLLGPNDLLIIDELSHASIANGAKCSRARLEKFRHNDLEHLSEILSDHRASHSHCLIVVEGLYSMDGDVPDLPRLLDIKEKHGAWLMIDEAHSHGVLGETGRGVCEHFGEDPDRVDLVIGTLSKAFISCGGFIAAKRKVIDLMRYALPGFVFSVGMPPMVAAAALKAVELAQSEAWRVKQLAERTEYFLSCAANAGFDTGTAIGRAVVPVLFRKSMATMAAAAELMEAGIYAPPIVQLGVPKDLPRIRFFISADHSHEDIDLAISVLARAAAPFIAKKQPSASVAELADSTQS
ncbi:MAG: aminotransferase class I/II-fold pyridoxal phosphate-dependent enzyme [Hyphomicrobiales bacterium]|nr:aminotransferase class I/II-fold pyridoxal phosphate-dependent enzyme [Hyphomicrobiales bacterium]